ncbi:MAG: substrate-binding domain-containing protein, partial [Micromonosporaceae bacterium]
MTGHILPRSRVWLLVAGTTVLAMASGLLVWVAVGTGCDGTLRLSVSAAPDIAPAVRESAAEWVTGQPHVGGTCVAPRISTVDPARVAAALNRDRGGDLDVAEVAAEGTDVPDVWIPDSSSWLTRVRTIDRQAFVGDVPSIAMSPVVLALPEPAARAEGWPAETIGWDHVLAGMKADPPLRFGIVEPRRSAVGLSGLLLTGKLAASAAKISDRDAETAVLGTYRGLSLSRAATTDELLGRLPRHASESEGRLGAALLSEHEVREYDASDPDVRLAAVYPEPAAPALDYPYATVAGLSTAESEAAGQFHRWLLGRKSRRLVTGHGFRTPDGATGPNFRTGDGVTPEPVPPPRSVTADDVTTALGLWTE